MSSVSSVNCIRIHYPNIQRTAVTTQPQTTHMSNCRGQVEPHCCAFDIILKPQRHTFPFRHPFFKSFRTRQINTQIDANHTTTEATHYHSPSRRGPRKSLRLKPTGYLQHTHLTNTTKDGESDGQDAEGRRGHADSTKTLQQGRLPTLGAMHRMCSGKRMPMEQEAPAPAMTPVKRPPQPCTHAQP